MLGLEMLFKSLGIDKDAMVAQAKDLHALVHEFAMRLERIEATQLRIEASQQRIETRVTGGLILPDDVLLADYGPAIAEESQHG